MSTPSLDELAAQISAATKVVSDYISSNNLPSPSRSVDAPAEFPVSAPKEVQLARLQIQEATRALSELTAGPSEHLRRLAVQVWQYQLSTASLSSPLFIHNVALQRMTCINFTALPLNPLPICHHTDVRLCHCPFGLGHY